MLHKLLGSTAAFVLAVVPASLGAQSGARVAPGFIITSPAFAANAEIPRKFTCHGDNVSPPLNWFGLPAKSRSLVLIVEAADKPDTATKPARVHWLLYNISVDESGLEEGLSTLPEGTLEGRNDFGKTRYAGPCPASGAHRYVYRLYALDTTLPDLKYPTRPRLEAAMKGHVVGRAELVGQYQKQK